MFLSVKIRNLSQKIHVHKRNTFRGFTEPQKSMSEKDSSSKLSFLKNMHKFHPWIKVSVNIPCGKSQLPVQWRSLQVDSYNSPKINGKNFRCYFFRLRRLL